jgi:glycosyltransferase A (GT-A) superfamily protein (DUF2064 family)
LLGTRAPLPESLFSEVRWGTSEVFVRATARLVELGVQVSTFSARHDIDVPADLERHAEALAKLSPADHLMGDESEFSGAVSSLSGRSGSN